MEWKNAFQRRKKNSRKKKGVIGQIGLGQGDERFELIGGYFSIASCAPTVFLLEWVFAAKNTPRKRGPLSARSAIIPRVFCKQGMQPSSELNRRLKSIIFNRSLQEKFISFSRYLKQGRVVFIINRY